MPELTIKQRTKINAAMAYLHSDGWQVENVAQAVKSNMAKGQSAVHAYETAFAGFMRITPAVRPVLHKIARLIEASDDATVAAYDAALTSYITTGDEAVLQAISPTIAADSVQLAIQLGEVDAETIAAHPDDWGSFAKEPVSVPDRITFDTGEASAPEQPVAGVWDETGYSIAKGSAGWQEAYAAAGVAPPAAGAAA